MNWKSNLQSIGDNSVIPTPSEEGELVSVACQTFTAMTQTIDWPCDLSLGAVNDTVEAHSCVDIVVKFTDEQCTSINQ